MKKQFIFLVLMLLCLLTSCSEKAVTKEFWMMDTYCSVTLYDGMDGKTEEGITKILEECEEDLCFINDNIRFVSTEENFSVPITNDIYELLNLCLEVCSVSQGAFDITTAPLTELWDISNATSPPAETEIVSALNHTGTENIILTKDSLIVLNKGSGIDLGAVGKGYTGDKTAQYLMSSGFDCGLLNLGGNITVFGENPKKTDGKFVIGIKNPLNTSQIFATVKVRDTNVVTAGGYERFFTYEGKEYHHILDPETGFPAEKGILSVTVICDNGSLADALSTAVYVSGVDKGMEILEHFQENNPEIAAVIYCEDGSVKTFNIDEYEYTEYDS